ncbi:MAG: SRPBCC family protein [Phycisphaerae bacterium]|nr:SRPBCC family protein [Phycisphaerae bacterium]
MPYQKSPTLISVSDEVTIRNAADPVGAFVLDAELHVPQAIDRVFDFFGDAFNLEQITPPFLRFEVLTPRPIPMAEGTLIDYRLKVRGLPMRWRSEITAWEPPFRFVDEQRKGPYRLWRHEHTFQAAEGGTIVRDRVTYRVPGGRLVNQLFVAPDLRRIFQYRRDALRRVLT